MPQLPVVEKENGNIIIQFVGNDQKGFRRNAKSGSGKRANRQTKFQRKLTRVPASEYSLRPLIINKVVVIYRLAILSELITPWK